MAKITGDMVAEKFLFFRQRARLGGFGFDRYVGGADEERVVPGNGKEDAAIGRLGNHERGIAGQKGARQNEMRSLADGQERIARAAVERKRILGVHSAGVNDRLCLHVEDGALFAVARLNPADFAAALDQSGGFNIVNCRAAEILEGAQQRDGIAGVVKLAVVVKNPAAQAGALDPGQLFERGLA